MTYTQPPDDAPGWRFQRIITPGGLLALITVLAGLFLWGGRVETQLAGVQLTQDRMADTDRRQWDRITAQDSRISELNATAARIDARTEAMADQLDRIFTIMAKERD